MILYVMKLSYVIILFNLFVLFHIMVLLFFSLQRHDIEKRRLDSHGNVIEARKGGIGGTKVSDFVAYLEKHRTRVLLL